MKEELMEFRNVLDTGKEGKASGKMSRFEIV